MRDDALKLLDFGIAKLLDPEASEVTVAPTRTGMRLMTPEYASPEQARGEAITTASDVYALGVLLYELLSGHRPYHFESGTPEEIARVICNEEPDRAGRWLRINRRPHELQPLLPDRAIP